MPIGDPFYRPPRNAQEAHMDAMRYQMEAAQQAQLGQAMFGIKPPVHRVTEKEFTTFQKRDDTKRRNQLLLLT